MLWLIGQIAVFLLIAVVLGFAIGWLLRGLWPSARARTREGELQTALDRATARISDLEAGLRAKRSAATAAAEQEQGALRRVEQLQAALDEERRRGGAGASEVEGLRAEIEAGKAEAGLLRRRVADLEVQAATLAAVEASRDAARARAEALEAELSRAGSPQRPLFAVPDRPSGAEPFEPPGEARDGGDAVPEPEPFEPPGAEGRFSFPDEPEPPAEPDLQAEADEPPVPEETPEEQAARLEHDRLEAVAEATERFRLEEPVEPDDLKEIYGVGPALERLLQGMNIFTFRQIAAFTEDDVALVSAALGRAFPDRITRDDWIGSARGLHRQKYGEDPPSP